VIHVKYSHRDTDGAPWYAAHYDGKYVLARGADAAMLAGWRTFGELSTLVWPGAGK
jgi:hypothetical protein